MTGRISPLKRAAVAGTAFVLLYMLGFGPCCWLTHRFDSGRECFRFIYWPVGLLAEKGPKSLRDVVWTTARFGNGQYALTTLPTSPFGTASVRRIKKGDGFLHGAIIFAGPMPGSPDAPRISVAPTEIKKQLESAPDDLRRD